MAVSSLVLKVFKHLKTFYKAVGEVDDYHTPLSCILNVSLHLASRRFYTGVVDPLEYYMDLSLLSPSTRLFQLSQLPSLKDLRRALKNKDLDFIGLSQAYKIQGVGQTLSEYFVRNGANQRFSVDISFRRFWSRKSLRSSGRMRSRTTAAFTFASAILRTTAR